MDLHKQVITTASLLMIFAIVGAGVVGLTFDNTYETIKRNEQLTTLKRLNTILPPESYDNDLLDDQVILPKNVLLGTDGDSHAYLAYKNSRPVAVVLSPIAPNGYNGRIEMLVGIKYDGTLAGVRITKHRETPGLGDAIEYQRSDWILGFDKKSLTNPEPKNWKVKRDGGHFDQFTGATITPRAVVKAVHSALLYFEQNRDNIFKQEKHAGTSAQNQ